MIKAFEMADVAGKAATPRRAVARGSLRMGERAYRLLEAGKLPKGDALKVAEVAGLQAAKRAPDTLPLCHPLPLDQVRVWFELDPGLPGAHAFCEASARAKTGVEMEALCGVHGALLALWDSVKAVDPALTIDGVRLELKVGGKSGTWTFPEGMEKERVAAPAHERGDDMHARRAVVVTVSDRCSRGEAEDRSGPILVEGLRALGFELDAPLVVPDERELIRAAILRAADSACLVVLTGGTGLSERDVTPEAVEAACARLVPGIGEALRRSPHPMAALSRSVAGQLGRSLVVALPGSPGGAKDGLELLKSLAPHALEIADGGRHA